ncbi:hypothetical protein EI534_19590 [Pseudomonas frederiksbergensis]|nr:hypothetical protein [Pseudomonas frederiksbergensis]
MTTPFKLSVKQDLWTRVGGCCSNPGCDNVTIGPALGSEDPLRTGEAAHIHSFEKNGPRYCEMTFEACQASSNGIWLCRICHKEVDLKGNEHKFPADMLRRWKAQAEERAYGRAGRPLQSAVFDPEKERKRALDFLTEFASISEEFFRSEYRNGRQLTSKAMQRISFGSRGFRIGGWNRDNPLWSHDDAIWRKQNDVISILVQLNSHISKKRWCSFVGDELTCNRFTESRFSLLSDSDVAYAEQLQNLLRQYFELADEYRAYINR